MAFFIYNYILHIYIFILFSPLKNLSFSANKDLFNASEIGDIAQMKTAIQAGADLERKNKANYDNTVASFNGRTEAVSLLLKLGADVNGTNCYNETSLWKACWTNKEEVVRILLQNGADVEKADVNGVTPLIAASIWGHSHCVKLLLEGGGQIHKTDDKGKSALALAKERGHNEVVKILEDWAKK